MTSIFFILYRYQKWLILYFFLFMLFSRAFGEKRILFIGNSYTAVNDLPGLVYNVALANGDTIIYDAYDPGGYTFELHSADASAIAKINSNSWDYVILQEQSQRPSFPPSQVQQEVYPFAMRLDSFIHANNPCTQTVFYMTWGRKYGDQSNCANYPPLCTYAGMQERLRASYLEMGDMMHARVSPVGISFQNSIAADSTLELYNSDQSHPSPAGSYLAACTFYATLYKKSPVGTSYLAGLDSVTAAFLQNIAAHTVLDSLANWKIGVYEPNASFSFSQIGLTASFVSDSIYSTSHQWSFGSNLATPVYTFPNGGDFNVTHIACDACRCDSITQLIHISGIGIDETESSHILIYPNPASESIVIDDTNAEILKIELFDAAGKLISSPRFPRGGCNILRLPQSGGVYLLSISKVNGKAESRKIVVE